jgi:hypothetical protein
LSLPPEPSVKVTRTWPPRRAMGRSTRTPASANSGSGLAGPKGASCSNIVEQGAGGAAGLDQGVDLDPVLDRSASTCSPARAVVEESRAARGCRPSSPSGPPPWRGRRRPSAGPRSRRPGWRGPGSCRAATGPSPCRCRWRRVDADDDDRLAPAFAQAAGHDPDHAGVPVVAGDDHHGRAVVGARLHLLRPGACLLGDQTLDLLAAADVQGVQFLGDGPRLGRIVGGQQARAEIRLADPAAGVDARAQDEAGVEDDLAGPSSAWRRPAGP